MPDGLRRPFMGAPDKHFLLGHARWFGSDSLPNRLDHEVDAPSEWSEMGWRRQRLEPLLSGFLFPSAWSAFLLAAGGIPLMLAALGHGIGMDIRLGLGLWVGAFVLLWLGALNLAQKQIEGSTSKMLMWNLFRIETVLLAVLAWVIHHETVGFVAIIALLISIPLWLSHVVRIATLLAWPSGRWILPIAHVDVGLASLSEPWIAESRRWARRPLARRKIPVGETGATELEMVLFGVRHENLDYLAMHLVHPSGALLDPFVGPTVGDTIPFEKLGPIFADVPPVITVREFFGYPPVSPVVTPWPASIETGKYSEEE